MNSESRVVTGLVILSVVILGLLIWFVGRTSPSTDQSNLPAAVQTAVQNNDPKYPVGELVNTDDYQDGSANAKVTLVEFADFECPVCKTFYPTLTQLRQNFSTAELRIVWRNSPLVEIHNQALPAAEAAVAAQKQNKFPQFAQAMYDNQAQLGEDLYVKTATDLGLNMDQFNLDRHSDAVAWLAYRARNYMQAKGWELATPTLIINGVLYQGSRTLDDLTATIKAAEK